MSLKTVLDPAVNGQIQGLLKTFECFSSTFHGKFNFQGLFKTVLYIQVLFKPVGTMPDDEDVKLDGGIRRKMMLSQPSTKLLTLYLIGYF